MASHDLVSGFLGLFDCGDDASGWLPRRSAGAAVLNVDISGVSTSEVRPVHGVLDTDNGGAGELATDHHDVWAIRADATTVLEMAYHSDCDQSLLPGGCSGDGDACSTRREKLWRDVLLGGFGKYPGRSVAELPY